MIDLAGKGNIIDFAGRLGADRDGRRRDQVSG